MLRSWSSVAAHPFNAPSLTPQRKQSTRSLAETMSGTIKAEGPSAEAHAVAEGAQTSSHWREGGLELRHRSTADGTLTWLHPCVLVLPKCLSCFCASLTS